MKILNRHKHRGASGLDAAKSAWRTPMLAAAAALVLVTGVGTASASTTQRSVSAAADPSVANTWTVRVGSQSPDMAYQGMGFLPREVFINAGDTVNWASNSAEIHTVTFPGEGGPPGLTTTPPTAPLDTSNPLEIAPQAPAGSNGVFENGKYFSSGLMSLTKGPFPAVTDFKLTFPTPGDYPYLCLVHGATEVDIVHVAAAGTPYKYEQADYDKVVSDAEANLIKNGDALTAKTAAKANDHTVFMGADSMAPENEVMVMRFIQPKVTVHVGETVSFVNDNMTVPHTVTFGPLQGPPDKATGDPTHFSGGSLNSGIAPPSPAPGSTFKVTFTKAGTYPYVCILHADMNMVGEVVVLPAAAKSQTPATPATPAHAVTATPKFTG